MRNVTISLPADVYRSARIKAAQRDTSLSSLVREFPLKFGQEETDFDRRKRLQAEVLASVKRFRAGDRLQRDAIRERHALR